MSKRKISIILLLAVLVACIGILVVEYQTRALERWIDDVIYDNRNHYLPCEQLPAVPDVEKTLKEHEDIIQQIKQVNPGLVDVEIGYPCPDRADIIISYASHKDRLAIEAIIGKDDFWGIPYRLQNH
jgi:hypothetical protein